MSNSKILEEVRGKILDMLAGSKPLTAREIGERLSYPARGIEAILRHHPDLFSCKNEKAVQRWALASKRGPTSNEYKPLKDGEGLLSYMGYHVGHKGILRAQRRDILDRVMESTLPKIISAEYVAGCGKLRSQERLRKLADSLAAFRSDRKLRLNSSNDEAIQNWTHDLAYLKETYWDHSWTWRW